MAAELAVRSFVEGHLGQNATLGIQRNSARTIEAFNSWAHAVGARDSALASMATTLTALVLPLIEGRERGWPCRPNR